MINSSGRKSIAGARVPLNGKKDRDDQDLLLFKELHKRDKDRIASLLQPVSDEFEPNSAGNYALYRISSGKKGPGFEFLGENDKNDYDWLKTPPATPMFPSLEMESNNSENVVQRELPIIQFQPRSRFAENSRAMKGGVTVTPKSPISKPNQMPLRSVTPSERPTISAPPQTKSTTTSSMSLNQRMAQFTNDLNKRSNTQKQKQIHVLSSNLSSKDAKPKNRSTIAAKTPGFSNEIPRNLRADRAISATRGRPAGPTAALHASASSNQSRSTIAAKISGFSNETPPNNLRTDRAISATRGRQPAGPTTTLHASASSNQKPDPTSMSRRQSCSPIVTRGRKQSEGNINLAAAKGKSSTSGNNNETQILGSKMVDKVMNARRIGARVDKEAKPNTINQGTAASAGFGKIMSKSSLDLAHKHMEMKRDQTHSRYLSSTTAKKTSPKVN